MMKYLFTFIFIACFLSCVYDRLFDVALFKNNVGTSVYIYNDGLNADSLPLKHILEKLYRDSVGIDQSFLYTDMGGPEIMTFYFFRCDSLNKYLNSNAEYKYLYDKAFLKRISFKRKRDLSDTIFIKAIN